MSSYVVLARKWRPGQFADIVGQTSVVRTLMNTIRAKRIHHAYLLTGSRGIGKTSIARIFAKAIRCEATATQADGYLFSCDQCSSCKEIGLSTSVDVIEIDGASNNGVDAIREIRENAKFLPSFGSKKIYIIDEVHMLTTAAFNALLKTLEEPPDHVIFVFATTEAHKIPATILSRLQRFDLRKVTIAQIQTRLKQVLDAEKVEIEAGALSLIARAAEGGMRDALSILDQVIGFSGTPVTVEAVHESIGLIGTQVLVNILAGIFKRDPIAALSLVQSAYDQGQDLKIVAKGILELLHSCLLAKVGVENAWLEYSEENRIELSGLLHLREIEEIELFFQAFHHGLETIARAPQPKLNLDVLIIKCATADALIQIDSPGAAPAGGLTSGNLSGVNVRPQGNRGFVADTAKAAPVVTQTLSIPPSIEAPVVTTTAIAPDVVSTPEPIISAAPAPLMATLEVIQPTTTVATVPVVSTALSALPSTSSTAKTWEGLLAFIRQTRPLTHFGS